MRGTTVFNKLLSLQGAFVRRVEFLAASLTIVVTVVPRKRRHRCPQCGCSTAAGYDHHQASWRHVPLGRWRVVLRATLYRLECPTHGVITEAVPWAAHGARFTLDFEELVAWLSREMNRTAVTRLMHICWATVGRIIERVVERKLDPRRLERLYCIGVDEVSYRKGHRYLTVVADHEGKGVVFAAEGRSGQTLGGFFDEVGAEGSQAIEAVTMDMSAAYMSEVAERAPQARIVFDPFHVVQLANEAVHEVRREEARERKGTAQAEVLKGARWALLKAPETLRPAEAARLSDVAAINRRVYRAYLLKEELRMLYRCGREAARAHLGAWLSWASRSRLAPFTRVARTLRTHIDGVLAAIELGLANARLEGLNNKIGLLIRRAYGFHSVSALIALVYLCCGGIQLRLPI